ncbi:MAG: hypothetical protein AB7O56_09635 [Bauldia sp.]
MKTVVAGGLLAVVASALPALADPVSFEAFGRPFEVRGEAFAEELWLDGTKVHENGFIFIDAIGIVGGTPVIVGTSATGGNACGGAPFVVSFPPGGAPVFDGPIDTCAALAVTIEANDVLFRGTPSVLAPAEQYSWHPGGVGFVAEAALPFAPSKQSGWDAIAAGAVSHPFDLLDYADMVGAFDMLVPADVRDEVLLALSGPGTGERQPAMFVGEACFPHNCPYSQALVVADEAQRRLYLAWSIDGVETIEPAEIEWTEGGLVALAEWRAANAAMR